MFPSVPELLEKAGDYNGPGIQIALLFKCSPPETSLCLIILTQSITLETHLKSFHHLRSASTP